MTQTIKQHATAAGLNPDSIRRRYTMPDGSPLSLSAEVTADVWQQILEKKNGASGQTRTAAKHSVLQNARPSGNVRAAGEHGQTIFPQRTDTDTSDKRLSLPGQPDKSGQITYAGQPDTDSAPDSLADGHAQGGGQNPDTSGQSDKTGQVITSGLDLILAGVVGGHAILIAYECFQIWGTPGGIGGGVALLIITSAVLLSADSSRVRTSATALWFVFLIDVLAWWVHFYAMRNPNISDTITGVFAGVLCGCSWGALFLYRDSKLD